MKKLLNGSIFLLILFYCLERFTYNGFNSFLPIFLAKNFGLQEAGIDKFMMVERYFSLFSLILAAILIDRVKLFRNIQFYFIPLTAGLVLCCFNTLPTVLGGLSIMALAGGFIKVNVFVKLFESFGDNQRFDDRIYLLLYLAAGMFSGIAPIVGGGLYSMFTSNFAFSLLGLIIWIVFGILFFRVYKKDTTKDHQEVETHGNSNTLLIVVLGFITIIINGLLPQHFSFPGAGSTGSKGIIYLSVIIPTIVYYLIGILFLFVTRFTVLSKLIISIILVMICGWTSYFVRGSIAPSEMYTMIIKSLSSVAEVLLYPSVAAIILMNSQRNQRGTMIAILFILLSATGYINAQLLKVYFGWVIVMAEVLLAAILFLALRYKIFILYGTQEKKLGNLPNV